MLQMYILSYLSNSWSPSILISGCEPHPKHSDIPSFMSHGYSTKRSVPQLWP